MPVLVHPAFPEPFVVPPVGPCRGRALFGHQGVGKVCALRGQMIPEHFHPRRLPAGVAPQIHNQGALQLLNAFHAFAETLVIARPRALREAADFEGRCARPMGLNPPWPAGSVQPFVFAFVAPVVAGRKVVAVRKGPRDDRPPRGNLCPSRPGVSPALGLEGARDGKPAVGVQPSQGQRTRVAGPQHPWRDVVRCRSCRGTVAGAFHGGQVQGVLHHV